MTHYVDIDRGVMVVGPQNPTRVPLPTFIQDDILPMRIVLLKDLVGTNYTVIPVSGTTLEVALGRKLGSGYGNYYTQQFTWTASTDLANPYWEADFPMNTAAVASLLGSNPTAIAYFMIRKVTAGIPKSALLSRVTVHAAVIHAATLQVPPGLTPLSAEAANEAFVAKSGTAELAIINPATGKGFVIYADENGDEQRRPIT